MGDISQQHVNAHIMSTHTLMRRLPKHLQWHVLRYVGCYAMCKAELARAVHAMRRTDSFVMTLCPGTRLRCATSKWCAFCGEYRKYPGIECIFCGKTALHNFYLL